jgi:Uma2 family endonuclease
MLASQERTYNEEDMALDFFSAAEQLHRFSLEEYHQLIEAGGFDENTRVELIEGILVDMSPNTRAHDRAIRWLNEWLVLGIDRTRFEVGPQTALTLTDSEPEPDLTVVPRNAQEPYHPGTAMLVIEVAVSSQHRDLRQKPILYARAGVPEYWVVDLDKGYVVVHRTPSGDRFESIVTVPGDGRVKAQALELPELGVAELLAAAKR